MLFKGAFYKFNLFQPFLSISSTSGLLLLEIQFVITFFMLPTPCLFLKTRNKGITVAAITTTIKNKCVCPLPHIHTYKHAHAHTHTYTDTLIHKTYRIPKLAMTYQLAILIP